MSPRPIRRYNPRDTSAQCRRCCQIVAEVDREFICPPCRAKLSTLTGDPIRQREAEITTGGGYARMFCGCPIDSGCTGWHTDGR